MAEKRVVASALRTSSQVTFSFQIRVTPTIFIKKSVPMILIGVGLECEAAPLSSHYINRSTHLRNIDIFAN